MKNFKPALLVAGLAASAALLSAPAHADGLYIGANLGTPHFGDSGVNGVFGRGSGAAGKIYGGWQFNPYFALEVGATGLGRISNGYGTVNSHGEFVDAVGILPLSTDWSLLGRVGVTRVSLNTNSGDDSGTGYKVGLGAQYALTQHLALRGEWENYRPDAFGTRPNISQYTVGLRYGF